MKTYADRVKDWDEDIDISVAKNRAEHQALAKKCYPSSIKDGEEKVIVVPAYDFRGGPDDQYGQHYAELIFAKRKGNTAVSATFFTGWGATEQASVMDGRNIGLMCTGIYTHHKFKKDADDDAYHPSECPWIGGKRGCYGELGSSLYGDVVLARLIHEGSAGVWDELDKALNQSH